MKEIIARMIVVTVLLIGSNLLYESIGFDRTIINLICIGISFIIIKDD